METDRDNEDQSQVRIERMMSEFRSAQQRQLVKRGIALWTRTELALGFEPRKSIRSYDS